MDNEERTNEKTAASETEYRPKLIFAADGSPDPRSLAEAIYETLDRRSAGDPSLLRLNNRTDLCEYIVICTALSTTHLRALSDEVEYRLGLCGVKAESRDGRGDGQSWTVIDYGSTMVHLFTAEARAFYSIDRLFHDAERIVPSGADAHEEKN